MRTLTCEECGKKLKQISWNHLRKHNLTVDEYKEKYGLPYTKGLTSESTKQKKRRRQKELIKEGRVTLISASDPGFSNQPKKKIRKSPMKRIGHPMSDKLRQERSVVMKQRYKTDERYRKNLQKGWERERCFLCSYERRDEIEKMILNEMVDTKVAEHCPITWTSVQRHRVNCMGIKVIGRQRGSQRKEMKCKMCGKDFIYYKYDRTKYGVPNYNRKYCGNKCKGLGMRKS